MSVESNRAALLRLYDEVVSKGAFEVIPELVHPDVEIHAPLPSRAPGAEGLREGIGTLRQAYSDFTATPQAVIAEHDRVAARFRITGVHVGEIFGVPPSGTSFEIAEMVMARFERGLVREIWAIVDVMSLLEQLGAVPAMAGTD